MLDLCTGRQPPAAHRRAAHGTYPIVAWSRDGALTWGTEAIMLSAGTNVQWLVEDLGVIGSPAAESRRRRQRGEQRRGGLRPRPARSRHSELGLRSARNAARRHPRHDHRPRRARRARRRGPSGRRPRRGGGGRHRPGDRHAAGRRRDEHQSDVRSGRSPTCRGVSVEVSPVADATTLGAAFLAGLAVGMWDDVDDAAALWRPQHVAEPSKSTARRTAPSGPDAVERAVGLDSGALGARLLDCRAFAPSPD